MTIPETLDTSCPVLLLGGEANSVALAEHFADYGIAIRVTGDAGTWALRSRYCTEAFPVPKGQSTHAYWHALLLSPEGSPFEGHVIFAMCDDAIDFVIQNEDALRARYKLEKFDVGLRRAMLDKQETLRLANEVGVPAPAFWAVKSREDVLALRDQVTFPAMVKPITSHKFVEAFGRKLFIIEDDFDTLVEMAQKALDADVDIQIVEMIPGPDDLLSSYYTYLDDNGLPLFHFTKSVLRRFPTNSGGAVYHKTEWLPETAEMGLKYLRGIGWRGLANIEFKRDTRDGQLKVIEINARFTAAHRLVLRSGAPIDLIAYCDLTDQPAPVFTSYRENLRLYLPLRDFRAFLELRQRGELSFGQWLASVPLTKTVFPFFSVTDPRPALARLWHSVTHIWSRVLG